MRRAYAAMGWIARVGIGLVLIYSGMVKVAQPYDFLNSVFHYEMFGPASATVVAGALPFVELTVGIALLCGVFTLGASSVASALLLVFTVGQASALLRGIDADCGCFGAGEKVGWTSLLRTVGLLGSALVSFVSAARATVPPYVRPPRNDQIYVDAPLDSTSAA